MPVKASKPTKPPPEQPADPQNELVLCEQEVERMKQSGTYDVKLVSHLSWLKLNAARTENELAKIAERQEKRLRSISWAQAVGWSKRLTDAEWSRFVREVVQAREGRGSVLG